MVGEPKRLCSVCSLSVDANGEGDKCFLHKQRPDLKTHLGGKELPLAGPSHDHRVLVETVPDHLSVAFMAYRASGGDLSAQEWHDRFGPSHPLCSVCELNVAGVVVN